MAWLVCSTHLRKRLVTKNELRHIFVSYTLSGECYQPFLDEAERKDYNLCQRIEIGQPLKCWASSLVFMPNLPPHHIRVESLCSTF